MENTGIGFLPAFIDRFRVVREPAGRFAGGREVHNGSHPLMDTPGNRQRFPELLENLNALFISENLPQADRLVKLNTIAIHQMRLLTDDAGIRKIGSGDSTKERKQLPDKDFDTVMNGIKVRRKKKSR